MAAYLKGSGNNLDGFQRYVPEDNSVRERTSEYRYTLDPFAY